MKGLRKWKGVVATLGGRTIKIHIFKWISLSPQSALTLACDFVFLRLREQRIHTNQLTLLGLTHGHGQRLGFAWR